MIVLGETRPVARKQHHCDECGGAIEPGSRYVRQRNVADGDAYTYRAHEDCMDVAIEYLDHESMWRLSDCPLDELRKLGTEGVAVADRITAANRGLA